VCIFQTSEIPHLRLWSHQELLSNCDIVKFQTRVFGTCSVTTFLLMVLLIKKSLGRRERVVVCLSDTSTFVPDDLCSVFAVYCPSFGAPSALLETLSSPSGQPSCRFDGTLHGVFPRSSPLIRRNRSTYTHTHTHTK